jgi:nitrite reductase/ring-hydroxylating ferredoxin subunit
MAFPALGLHRIVWAIDVLQAHAVPGFAEVASHAAGAGDPALLDVCAVTELPEGQTVKHTVQQRPMLLFRRGQDVHAFKAYCSHQGMELMASGLAGARVTCRQHGWQFELPEGTCAAGPRWGLTRLPVTLASGRVQVAWAD